MDMESNLSKHKQQSFFFFWLFKYFQQKKKFLIKIESCVHARIISILAIISLKPGYLPAHRTFTHPSPPLNTPSLS